MDTRPSSHRSARSSPRRPRRPSRSSLVVGLVVVLLGTVPVLVPLLVTGASGESAVGAPPAVVGAGVPALPRSVPGGPAPGGTSSPISRAATPARPADSLARTTPTPTSTSTPAGPTPTSSPAATVPPSGSAPSTGDPPPTTLVAEPDLVVVSVSWSPRTPAAGDQVIFRAVVRNVGTDPTPVVEHGVAFLVDGTKVSSSAGDTSSLAAGAQRRYTADRGPTASTWLAAPGVHSVTAWVDDLGHIGEIDDQNNTGTATLTIG